METYKDISVCHASDRKSWRTWLAKNHQSEKSVWLVIHHKSSGTPSVYYEEAVEEALCFGWIDSVAYKRNQSSKYQFFTVRKPKSGWSRINKERAERMIRDGLMKPAGQAMIDLAKKSGTWTALDEVENVVIPPDLLKALARNKTALKYFSAFPPSSKKIILHWIHAARRPETRQQRIRETVRLAKENRRANHFKKKTDNV